MQIAVKLAHKAARKGEVPVAAVVVGPEGLVSYAINSRERQQTPLGHAELFALHKASQKRRNWRLADCTLYVTLEPCLMCAGAIQQSRIQRVVYGASDLKAGAVESLYHVLEDPRLNHQTQVTSGVLKAECSELLQSFFKNRRDENKKNNGLAQTLKIPRKRASVVVIYDGKILGFHATDPTSGAKYFFLPGGAIEPHESPAESAARECLEETGYEVKILEDTAFERKYDFAWDGQIYASHTVFYVAELERPWQPPQAVQDAAYHQGVEWMDIRKVPQLFAYHRDILWAVQKLLKTAQKRSALR